MLSPELGSTIQMLENSYVKRGRKQGLQEGLLKKAQMIAINMLQARFDRKSILTMTGLSEDALCDIEATLNENAS